MPLAAQQSFPNALRREVDVLRAGFDQLAQRLPRGWTAEKEEDVRLDGANRADAIVHLKAPGGQKATVIIEAKRLMNPRDVAPALEQLERYARTKPAEPMLVARYLTPSTRERLDDLGVSYADATGNVSLSIDQPALFLRDRGADKDPWRGPGRPRGTLKGEPAARVVRALIDYAPPFTARRLVDLSGASTGAVYRVLDFLGREDLIERQSGGQVVAVSWRRLLQRWSQDYGFQLSNPVATYLEPRGVPRLLDALRTEQSLDYVLTGSLAAARLAPYASPRAALLYVDDPVAVADRLGLRAVDSGNNILVAAAAFRVVLDRSIEADGLRWAAPAQVAVDLLTGPGRNPSEAEALLDWMEANEDEWRR